MKGSQQLGGDDARADRGSWEPSSRVGQIRSRDDSERLRRPGITRPMRLGWACVVLQGCAVATTTSEEQLDSPPDSGTVIASRETGVDVRCENVTLTSGNR